MRLSTPGDRVDKAGRTTLIVSVGMLPRFVALCLLALWLPATLHCDLEAAGVTHLLGCHDHRADAPAFGHGHHCHSIDGLSYRLDGAALKAPAPLADFLFVLAHPDFQAALEPPRVRIVAVDTSPPELPRTWQFVVRAAPPARAPAFAA